MQMLPIISTVQLQRFINDVYSVKIHTSEER